METKENATPNLKILNYIKELECFGSVYESRSVNKREPFSEFQESKHKKRKSGCLTLTDKYSVRKWATGTPS